MGSSFATQIPSIIHIVQQLKPKSIIDIGKGFGKYGFLIHEYLGIPTNFRIDPLKKMCDQSSVKIDAVEVDPDLMLPHLLHFYNNIYFKNINEIYKSLPNYDLVVMIDIIEHIEMNSAIEIVKHFIDNNSVVLIATPIHFFQQELYESQYERHVSHWKLEDFIKIAHTDVQKYSDGAVYLLSKNKLDIIGWGSHPIKKIKRIFRAIINEL